MEYSYQKLDVWKKSMDLIDVIYEVTRAFPKSEFSLIDQMKRAAISIASNIAEWDQRNTDKETVNFLFMSKWSAAELQTQLIIAQRQKFIDINKFESTNQNITEILKMLSWLITYKRSHTK